jgi:hypothetical protein
MGDLKSQLEQATVQDVYELFAIVFKFVMKDKNFLFIKEVNPDETHYEQNTKKIICRFCRTNNEFVVKMSVDNKMNEIFIAFTGYESINTKNTKP